MDVLWHSVEPWVQWHSDGGIPVVPLWFLWPSGRCGIVRGSRSLLFENTR